MKINLISINNELICRKLNIKGANGFPFTLLYADFNVLNYFYNNNYKEEEFKNMVLYPDSSAIWLYIKYFLKRNFREIISTDIQDELLCELNKNQLSIYLLGDADSIIQRAVKNIEKKYPKINVVDFHNGYNFRTNKIISEININKIDVLFVGLGVGRQEKWILENYSKLNVNVIMSVGGWFQYLAKNKTRAPLLLRKTHTEWLYKLCLEFPRVWKRYLIGVPKFYFRVITKNIFIKLIDNE